MARALSVTASDLARLPRAEVLADFSCEEGWTVQGLCWQGVRLKDVLALVRPLPGATYVRVCSGKYAVPLPTPDVGRALLCEAVDGERLTDEQGGPWRLLLPGGRCFTSVKWVDRLEVTVEPGEPTGERIARERIARPVHVGAPRSGQGGARS